MEPLLAAPLRAESVLSAKRLSSLFADQPLAPILAILWLIGLGMRAIDPLAALAVAGLWLACASYMASVGIYYSIICQKTGRAVVLTLLTAGVTLAIISILAFDLSTMGGEPGVLVPPIGLAALTSALNDFTDLHYWQSGIKPWLQRPTWTIVRYALGGSSLWIVLAAFVGWMGRFRFRRLLGRNRQGNINAPRHQHGTAERTDTVLQSRFLQWHLLSGFAWDMVSAVRYVRLPRLRFGLLLAAIPVALLIACYATLNHSAAGRLDQACQRAYATDGPWQTADLAGRSPSERGDRAGLIIVGANELLKRRHPSDARLVQAATGLSNLPPEVLKELESIRMQDSDILAKVRSVADFENATLPADKMKDVVFPWDIARGQLQGLVRCDLFVRSRAGDWRGAMRSLKCALILCQAGSRGVSSRAFGGAYLDHAAGDPDLANSVCQVLMSGALDDKGLQDLQKLLEARALEPLPSIALRHYRAARLNWLCEAQEGNRPAIGFGSVVFGLQWQQLIGQDERRRAADEIDFLTDLIEILKEPQGTHKTRFMAISNPAMRWRFQEITELKDSDAFRRANIVIVAAKRFHLAHGRWPEKLSELMPAFLKAIPTDPFDGRPLRSRLKGDRIVIYSVGRNVADDEGAIRPLQKTVGGRRVWQQALDTGMDIAP